MGAGQLGLGGMTLRRHAARVTVCRMFHIRSLLLILAAGCYTQPVYSLNPYEQCALNAMVLQTAGDSGGLYGETATVAPGERGGIYGATQTQAPAENGGLYGQTQAQAPGENGGINGA